MTMKAIVYDEETGEIERQMHGAVPVEKQRLDDHEALLTDAEVDFPDDLRGKLVDGSSDPPSFVDDTAYSPPESPMFRRDKVSTDSKSLYSTHRQARLDAKDAGDVQPQLDALQDQLDDLFEIIVGERL